MKRQVLVTAGFLLTVSLSSVCAVSDASADALIDALSDRHSVPSFSELEKIAGGHDALISKLIELRGDQTTPMIGMRSAKILLENFQGEEAIATAFEEDLQRDDRKGIAEAISMNLDKVPSAAARQRLARGILDKASHDEKFAKYAKNLASSKDETVRALAKQELK